MFLSSVLKCQRGCNVHPRCCTIWWFTTSQLWLTVWCSLNWPQRLIISVPTACLSLGGVYDDWVYTFPLEGPSADTVCLWWHQHAVGCSPLWVIVTTESFTNSHLQFWLLPVLKHLHRQHKAGVFQSQSSTQQGLKNSAADVATGTFCLIWLWSRA